MDITAELAALAAEQRRLATRMDRLAQQLAGGATPVFDPDTDEPPVTPAVNGDPAQRAWCGLLLWARLFAINARQHRGATMQEVVQIAKDAGYVDGRGWNKWTGWKDDGGRWVTADGIHHLQHYYKEMSRTLPSDLAEAARRLSD